MKLNQEFTVARPIAEVWAFFHDIPRVAACLPGAEYLSTTPEGLHTGKVSAKIGPFQANFEGEADVRYDEAAHRVHLEGKGVDRKGASRGKMVMECALIEAGDVTKVTVDSDVQLSGTIAQFGRTGLITEIANVLVADFVRNAEAELVATANASSEADTAGVTTLSEARPTPAPNRPISGFALLTASLRGWLRSLFGKRA